MYPWCPGDRRQATGDGWRGGGERWRGEGRARLTRTGDTKFGKLIGSDIAGNKFFENSDELPRTYPLTPHNLQ
ncbi:hypothetical protein IMZ48_02675 [Candidatus Bathyarchaeota archaeon]|nr:hypothetical protein [Candidatus Bathyarchaeota archaeon]